MPRTYPPEPLTAAEVRALLDACRGDDWISLRNRALIALLYRSGLRISEALALRPKDIDHEAGTVRVLRGKGGRARTVGIDPGGAALVAAWAKRRALRGHDGAAPLFCTASGRAIHAGQARRLFRRLGVRAGIDKRVHPHGLRHTHAAELRAEGVDIGIISKQLGHRSIATTARYLDHIAPAAVVAAMRGRAWGAPPH
jgi:integrase